MEHFSQITDTTRLEVNIDVPPHLRDHCFEGRAVLPAVEAVRVLAAGVRSLRPKTVVGWMTGARFDKFLYIEPGCRQIDARIDLAVHANGDVSAGLLTRSRAPKVAITRVKEHAMLCFPATRPDVPRPEVQRLSVLQGRCVEIPADVLYRELVPFGRAYHNIRTGVRLAQKAPWPKLRCRLQKTRPAPCRSWARPLPWTPPFMPPVSGGSATRALLLFRWDLSSGWCSNQPVPAKPAAAGSPPSKPARICWCLTSTFSMAAEPFLKLQPVFTCEMSAPGG